MPEIENTKFYKLKTFLVDKLEEAIPDGQFVIISEISVFIYSDQNQFGDGTSADVQEEISAKS